MTIQETARRGGFELNNGLATLSQAPCHHLATERLLLRCPSPEDGPILHAAILDLIHQLRPWFSWATEENLTLASSETTARYAYYRFQNGTEFDFYLFAKGRSPLIGVCGLGRPEWSLADFELSYWLRTGYEGQGYMTEAATAVIDFAFDTLACDQLIIRSDPMNGKSVALARRLGFITQSQIGSEIVLTRFANVSATTDANCL